MAERNLDFDKVIDRSGTFCIKHDFKKEWGIPEDALSLWVADMDFQTTSYVEDALEKRIRHNVYGYTDTKEEYFEAVSSWMKRRHGWDVEKDWLVKTPGVVFALATAVKAYTEPGDPVLIQLPVYHPFKSVIEDNKRRVVSNDLFIGDDGRYRIDFEDFEEKIRTEKIKLFILCSPHNPVGRVWTREELKRMGDICLKYGVTVISDEIHGDIILEGEHTVFASVKKEFEKISIICTSPSKSFNLAGMLISNIFIPDPELRKSFKKEYEASGMSELSALGLVAAEAAYRNGEEWFDAMLSYVRKNMAFAKEFTEKNLPGVNFTPIEGTYLIWLDFRKLGLSRKELDDIIINKAKLWLDSGRIFGKPGEGFQRINAACPRSALEEAFNRIKTALF